MKIVGERLQGWAIEKKVQKEKDLFARSAFNRFYYAAFLITREVLGDLKPEWKKQPHKNIPDLLVTLQKPIKSELKTQLKAGLISESARSRTLTVLNGSASELSNLLRKAYTLRVVADYEPEVPIKTDNKILLLDDYKLNTAQEWPGKARACCKSIRKIWRDTGLASN